MYSRDADFLGNAATIDFDMTTLGQRLVILRNLVSLGQVRIKIILARENRSLMNLAIQSHRREHGKLHNFAIKHRQGSGQTQTHGTDIGIGGSAEAGGAGTENLGRSQ
jgi:hypothetical protein